jgi:S-formylglutathione hydrolase
MVVIIYKPASMRSLQLLIFLALFVVTAFAKCYAQSKPMQKGTVERIVVHGKSLEGNLSGDSPDREVSVYLPPSYGKDRTRRYPVIYFLHGFTDKDSQWYGPDKHWINLPSVVDKALSNGSLTEMIIVTPNAYTRFQGSGYSNSVTTGNWEEFIAIELVQHIDKHYRTIANRASRGLAGHSFGGYGTLRIGQKNPQVFSSLYLLSPCCLAVSPEQWKNLNTPPALDSILTQEQFEKAPFGVKATFAAAAAWTPNPANPPFFLDLPAKNGVVQPLVISKRMANLGLSTLDQHINSIKQLKAIGFDAGDKDKDIAYGITLLDEQLNRYGVTHLFEVYEGDHLNRVAERIETKMLVFFSRNLEGQK